LRVSGFDRLLGALLPVSRGIDNMSRWIGRHVAWLILAAVIVSSLNAVIRKVFDTSSNSWLELQWVLFSIVFLVNNMLPKPLRNWIDVIGHAFFLLPLCVVMVLTGIPFFWRSWLIGEQSGNAGGLPQWPAKSLLMFAFALLLLQAISELIKRLSVMRGLIPDPHEGQKSSLEAEAEEIIGAIEKH
jgi:TRAP-type mannitol/chloroaromatic compound transport system permease small subunit